MWEWYTCVMIVDEGHVIGWHVCEGDVCVRVMCV